MTTFPAVVITGPRQSGKTTLLRMVCASTHRYLSLEDHDIRQQALSDPRGFFAYHAPPVILDEIQYAPELLPFIKSAIDQDRTPGQWMLTGSQNFPLMQGVSETLAGRAAVLRLLPLATSEVMGEARAQGSLDELLGRLFSDQPGSFAAHNAPELADWLLRGAYPEIRANPQVDRQLWCRSYVQTYLERDVRQITNVGDLNSFDRFLRLSAARTGQVLNISELARDAAVSPPTARKWLSVLEASGVIFLLPPYFRNFGKRIIKSPKLYFIDSALASFLLGLHDVEPVLHGPQLGSLLETAVVSAWVKAFENRGEQPALYYWRSRSGLEVDLVLERNNKLYAAEVKATATVRPAHGESLDKWQALSGQCESPCLVFANVPRPCQLTPAVRAVPWWIV